MKVKTSASYRFCFPDRLCSRLNLRNAETLAHYHSAPSHDFQMHALGSVTPFPRAPITPVKNALFNTQQFTPCLSLALTVCSLFNLPAFRQPCLVAKFGLDFEGVIFATARLLAEALNSSLPLVTITMTGRLTALRIELSLFNDPPLTPPVGQDPQSNTLRLALQFCLPLPSHFSATNTDTTHKADKKLIIWLTEFEIQRR
ncbi:uncharacterized protein BDR25DRAFT_354253 [Lindgomyces ingoldianus]|uniref:Uncharacterized protein n=1 Tax=Lindgomyces ingoldianus TaxID=673940 RepID=A0ACB6QXX6_9PLEO|nr:uncharacterized protein BDR25DRAFT_354253 [Lindgomyces ingoldianus]KAF2471766.1 hypothetical protein BDR25DRAFT_354253 [Lindgomyces ingoldianus]